MGLTRLRLFDIQGFEIALRHEDLACQNRPILPLSNLLKTNPFTSQHSDMFLTELPSQTHQVDVKIKYFGKHPGLLRLWNFNSNKGKGVKALQITINNIQVADQILLAAPQTTDKSYHQDIILNPDTVIPGCLSPRTHQMEIERSFEELFDKIGKEVKGYIVDSPINILQKMSDSDFELTISQSNSRGASDQKQDKMNNISEFKFVSRREVNQNQRGKMIQNSLDASIQNKPDHLSCWEVRKTSKDQQPILGVLVDNCTIGGKKNNADVGNHSFEEKKNEEGELKRAFEEYLSNSEDLLRFNSDILG